MGIFVYTNVFIHKALSGEIYTGIVFECYMANYPYV